MNVVGNNTDLPQQTGRPSQGHDFTPLIRLSPKEVLMVKASFEGIVVTGSSSSGKTSGAFGKILARAMLQNQSLFLNAEDEMVVKAPSKVDAMPMAELAAESLIES